MGRYDLIKKTDFCPEKASQGFCCLSRGKNQNILKILTCIEDLSQLIRIGEVSLKSTVRQEDVEGKAVSFLSDLLFLLEEDCGVFVANHLNSLIDFLPASDFSSQKQDKILDFHQSGCKGGGLLCRKWSKKRAESHTQLIHALFELKKSYTTQTSKDDDREKTSETIKTSTKTEK